MKSPATLGTNPTSYQLEQYQKSLLTYWELKGVVDTAREEGLAEGHEKGLAEGHEKGLAEGHEKGLVEGHEKGLVEGHEKGLAEGLQKGREEGHQAGKQEGIFQVATTMKVQGLSIEIIERVTGLTRQELASL
jgi:flagellar biosynthesis/type III secretory pathway protein FliH